MGRDRIKTLVWNLEWSPAKVRPHQLEIIEQSAADVLCLTETTTDIAFGGMHTIECSADYGYKNPSGKRRKVVLHSKEPWRAIDTVGDPEMPPGRFVSGVSFGIRWVGVCIPWHSAHVSTGRRDRKRWDEHLSYLHALSRVLDRFRELQEPICVLGDFNQRVPRLRQPVWVYEALLESLGSDQRIVTEGITDDDGRPMIDHASISDGLQSLVIDTINRQQGEIRLSDHSGVVLDVRRD